MINKTGPAYEAAQKRVNTMGLMQYAGAPLGLDLFPEGEQEQRQLQVEYGKAIDASKAGDNQALSAFFDKYPEYEARAMAFKDPATQVKQFLISEVWDNYNALSALDKRQASTALGATFQDAFLNKATRSYDAIPAQTLANWAKSLGGEAPKLPDGTPAGDTPALPLKLADPTVSGAYQQYVDTKKGKFPGIGDLNSLLYGLSDEQAAAYRKKYPLTGEYSKWNNAYLASHPQIIPYVVGDQSELAGVDPKVAQQVFAFRAARYTLFPQLDQLEEEYYGINPNAKSNVAYPQSASQKKAGKVSYQSARSVWLEQHPDLKHYWTWRTTYALDHPDAAQYILSAQSLQSMQAGLATGQTPERLSPEAMTAITQNEALMRQIYLASFGKGSLSAGSLMALEGVWKSQGRPGGDFQDWVNEVVEPQFGVKR
jgi:hypothetical protein